MKYPDIFIDYNANASTCFRLSEVTTTDHPSLDGVVDIYHTSIAVGIAGYGNKGMKEGHGRVFFLEQHDGELRLVIHANINDEEPTHIIPLTGALESSRKSDMPDPKDYDGQPMAAFLRDEEHPDYPVATWSNEIDAEFHRLGYWQWVRYKLKPVGDD